MRESVTNGSPNTPTRYVVWEPLEPDKVASLWLIRRHIHKSAAIDFVPKGTFVTNGIAIDTPDANFRRTHTLSCYQSLLQYHAITNAELIAIGAITHDIEINSWGAKQFPESESLETELTAIVEANPLNPALALDACFPVLDALEATFSNR